MADEEVLERIGDSALVRGVQEHVDAKVERGGVGALSPEERTVYLVLWTKGIVDNGGFRLFVHGRLSLAEVAEAYARVGLDSMADACSHVLNAVFPDGVPSSQSARIEAVDRCECLIEADNEQFWFTPYQDVESAVARFIRANGGAFALRVS